MLPFYLWHDKKIDKKSVEIGVKNLKDILDGFEDKFPVKYFGSSSNNYFRECLENEKKLTGRKFQPPVLE